MSVVALCFSATVFADHIIVDRKLIRQPLPGKTVAVAYLRIINNGDHPLSLVLVEDAEGSSESAAKPLKIEMHETVIKEGRSRMMRHDAVAIPAKGEVRFESQGLHLMLFNWQATKDVSKNLVLHFDDGSQFDVEFPLSSW